MSNLLLQDCEGASIFESAPSGNNILCGTESWFTQRTVDPRFTVILLGSKAKFVILIVFADTELVVCGTGMVVAASCWVVCRVVVTGVGGWTGGAVWVHPQTPAMMMIMARSMKPFFID